jgi:hypothetical protein
VGILRYTIEKESTPTLDQITPTPSIEAISSKFFSQER